jgi:hypothetical protein
MKSNSTLQYRVERARDIEAKDNETQINVFVVNLAYYLFLIEMTFHEAMRQPSFILYRTNFTIAIR